MDTNIFGCRESSVRGSCRAFPTVFTRAEGTWLIDETGPRVKRPTSVCYWNKPWLLPMAAWWYRLRDRWT